MTMETGFIVGEHVPACVEVESVIGAVHEVKGFKKLSPEAQQLVVEFAGVYVNFFLNPEHEGSWNSFWKLYPEIVRNDHVKTIAICASLDAIAKIRKSLTSKQ